jgi:hypothetical protein
MVDGPNGYLYTPGSGTFVKISDSNFAGGTTVEFIDGYFIVNNPNTNVMQSSSLNDGSVWPALNYTAVAGRPDNIVGLLTTQRELWVYKEHSIEVWFDNGNTQFPLSYRQGAFLDIGCGAAGSLQRFNNTIVWLDDRGFICQGYGYAPQVISTEAINADIRTYSKVSDAISFVYTEGNHQFYVITFPTAGKTWSYDSFTQMWHQRASTNLAQAQGRFRANCFGKYGLMNIIGDYYSGNVYIMSESYYDEAGTPIHRYRTTQHFANEFNLMTVDELEVYVETGKAPQGVTPQLMMRYSNDAGYTWSNELWASIGTTGQYRNRVLWARLGQARQWMFEFHTFDAMKTALIQASVQVSANRYS